LGSEKHQIREITLRTTTAYTDCRPCCRPRPAMAWSTSLDLPFGPSEPFGLQLAPTTSPPLRSRISRDRFHTSDHAANNVMLHSAAAADPRPRRKSSREITKLVLLWLERARSSISQIDFTPQPTPAKTQTSADFTLHREITSWNWSCSCCLLLSPCKNAEISP